MTMAQIVIMLVTLETYPTNLRSAAFSLGIIVGVSGLFIMNIVPFILVQISHFWPFLYFALICPLAIICSFSLELLIFIFPSHKFLELRLRRKI